MTAEVEIPLAEQTDYFRTVEEIWRGQINSEDMTVAALVEVLLQAREAGMPGDAIVSFPPGGDCVTRVHVTTKRIESLRSSAATS